ncbi:MAG TPA: LysM domain-containing protein [Candidatus Angelobacter sp.]
MTDAKTHEKAAQDAAVTDAKTVTSGQSDERAVADAKTREKAARDAAVTKTKILRSEKEARDAYVRWQKTRRDHLGSVVKLVLTLTIGALAFGVDLFVKRKAEAPVMWLKISLYTLIGAATGGLLVNITRFRDFHWTERAARMRQYRQRPRSLKNLYMPPWLKKVVGMYKKANKKAAADPSDPKDLWLAIGSYCKCKYEFWGGWTWRLVTVQFGMFGLGIAALVVGILLFPPEKEPPHLATPTAIVEPLTPDRSTAPNPRSETSYTVVPGDTLSKIAQKKCRDSNRWYEIYLLNQSALGVNPNALQPGQRLKLPGSPCVLPEVSGTKSKSNAGDAS